MDSLSIVIRFLIRVFCNDRILIVLLYILCDYLALVFLVGTVPVPGIDVREGLFNGFLVTSGVIYKQHVTTERNTF